jgi:hypothetical protein
MLISDKFQFNSIVQLLFQSVSDSCLIIVQYSDPGNVPQLFRSWYQQPSIESMNTIQGQDSPTFTLA